MKPLDSLFGRPTLPRFLEAAGRWLRQRGITHFDIEPVLRLLSIHMPDGGHHRIQLGRLWPQWQAAPRRQRPGLLHDYLHGLLTTGQALPTDYASARPHLRPVLRTREQLAAALQCAAAQVPQARQALVHRPWQGDLSVAMVIDQPTTMAYVQQSLLDAWGVPWEQAWDDALDNLRNESTNGRWQELVPGVWRGHWGDVYDSSRVLLPEVIHRGPARQPLVMVPFREALLLSSADQPQGPQAMLAWALGQLDGPLRWLSPELLQLQAQAWQPQEASGDATPLQAMLRLRYRVAAYEVQQAALAQALPGLQVAVCRVAQAQDGTLVNYTTWGDGQDTLLPEADNVLLMWQEAGEARLLSLPWASLQAHFADLLEPTTDQPPRYRARHFPDAARLAEVSQAIATATAGTVTRPPTLRLGGSAG